jgi:hypothetical protein
VHTAVQLCENLAGTKESTGEKVEEGRVEREREREREREGERERGGRERERVREGGGGGEGGGERGRVMEWGRR